MSVTRPSGYPGWASGASGWIAEPTALKKALGWQPSEAPPSSYQNWFQNLTYNWLTYIDQTRMMDLFGDGSDGNATLDGSATVSWATGPSGFAYRAVRDVFGNLIVVPSGVELQMAGYRLYCADELVATGTVSNNGGRGAFGTGLSGTSGGIHGAGALSGTIGGGGNGAPGLGIAGGGITGASQVASYGGAGGGVGAAIANGGSVVSPTGTQGSPHLVSAPLLGHILGAGNIVAFRGGGGGGGGAGGSPSGAGGAGGGGGGVLAIAARKLSVAAATCLQAYGGDGGTALGIAATAANGGGGGGGGVLQLIYLEKTVGISFTGTINCRGGKGGGGGVTPGATGGGTTGISGAPGTVFEFTR